MHDRYLLAHADPVLQDADSRRYACTRFATAVNNMQCQFCHYANPRHNDQIFTTCCIAQIHRAFDSGRLDANYCRNFGTKLRWDHSGFTEFRWDHSVQLGLH